MSGIVGNLFGSKGSRAESNSASGYAALPQNIQDIYNNAVTGLAGYTNNNPGIFAPAPLNQDELNAATAVRTPYTNIDASSVNQMLPTFMNPFTQDVVNTTNQQIQLANKGLLNDIGSDATAAGAFGGTRQAVAQAQQNKDALQTMANVDASLNQAGYSDALNNTLNALNTNNTLKSQYQTDLGALGSSLQNQSTAEQQAPLTGLATLLQALQGINTSTGTQLGAQSDPGFLGRLSSIAANFGQAAKGFMG